MSKKLVAYFSAEFGKTRGTAEKLAKAAGADLYEITPVEPYTREDLYWPNEKCRSVQETKYHPESRPAIKGKCENMEDYDFIMQIIEAGLEPEQIAEETGMSLEEIEEFMDFDEDE